MLVAGLLGSALLIVVDWRRWAIVLSFPAAYFLVIGNGHTAFIRYVTPLVPFVCIAAAFAVYWAIELAGAARSQRVKSWAMAAAVVLLGLPSTLTAVRFDRLLGQTDTRVLAAGWLRAEMRAGESLFESGASYARPHYAWKGADFVETEFDAVRAVFTTTSGKPMEPDWIVLAESPLRLYTNVPAALRGILTSRYRLVQTFAATREPEAETLFDRQDAFFLPYADFRARVRPGPNLSIYRLRDRGRRGLRPFTMCTTARWTRWDSRAFES